MGSHWVQPVFQIWTYPWIFQKTFQETPSRADSVMTHFPWDASCFFVCWKFGWFDCWTHMTGRLAVSFCWTSDVFFSGLLCWVAVGCWACWGWAVKKAVVFFQSLPTWKWNSSNNSLQILLFFFSLEPFWQQHHSVATTQHKIQNLTPRFLFPDLICKAQIFRVFPNPKTPPKKQQRTPIFGCLAAWIRGLSLKFPWKLATG